MAIPVARVHLAMAHAALPTLLPTPPKSKMLPLLPTPPPCVLDVLPISPPKASRADAVERWDARKTRPASPTSSVSSQRSTTTSSSRRADSEERWDARKKPVSLSSSSSSARSNSSKHRLNSRATSTAGHKKPTAARKDDNEIDDAESSTGSNDMEYLDMPPRRPLPQRAFYAGPGFMAAAPHLSMLPMPLSSMRIRVA